MNTRTIARIGVKGLIVGAGALVGALGVTAWTGPTGTAPNSNVSAPINVGTASQTKNGALGVNSLAVYGNASVSGSISTDEGVIRDGGGGWVRTYGNTGWYSQTYGGGWYMSDTTWLRSYNNKSIYTSGTIAGGTLSGSLTTTAIDMNDGDITEIDSLVGSGPSPGNIFIPSNVQINGDVSLVGGANIYGAAWFSGSSVDMPNINSGNGDHVCWNTNNGRLRHQNAACTVSDIRLKEHIKPLQPGLAEILKLNPVTYEWKDKERRGSGVKMGLIAQEVKEIFPELITGTGTGVDDDWYGVDYNGLAAPMIKAIQELKAENDELRAELAELRALIKNK
jgi:hypothetical protein